VDVLREEGFGVDFGFDFHSLTFGQGIDHLPGQAVDERLDERRVPNAEQMRPFGQRADQVLEVVGHAACFFLDQVAFWLDHGAVFLVVNHPLVQTPGEERGGDGERGGGEVAGSFGHGGCGLGRSEIRRDRDVRKPLVPHVVPADLAGLLVPLGGEHVLLASGSLERVATDFDRE